ncbi:MAG: hypothetical protein GWP74_16885 [Proteobacteria bacterium]|nr:hypothetical protein [Pseudomonadota bacterium]
MAEINVAKNNVVDLMVVGIGATIGVRDPAVGGAYTLVHTTTVEVTIARMVGNVDIEILLDDFYTSAAVTN